MSKEIEKPSHSAVDQMLLRNARRSMNELSEMTGLTPEETSERLTAVLDVVDWRTVRQEERLLIIELRDILDGAKEMLSQAEDVTEYASVLGRVLQTVKIMFDRIDVRRKDIDEDYNRITLAQARIWAQAIGLAQEKAAFQLQKMYPEIEAEVIDAVFEDALPLAVKELESHAQ